MFGPPRECWPSLRALGLVEQRNPALVLVLAWASCLDGVLMWHSLRVRASFLVGPLIKGSSSLDIKQRKQKPAPRAKHTEPLPAPLAKQTEADGAPQAKQREADRAPQAKQAEAYAAPQQVHATAHHTGPQTRMQTTQAPKHLEHLGPSPFWLTQEALETKAPRQPRVVRTQRLGPHQRLQACSR